MDPFKRTDIRKHCIGVYALFTLISSCGQSYKLQVCSMFLFFLRKLNALNKQNKQNKMYLCCRQVDCLSSKVSYSFQGELSLKKTFNEFDFIIKKKSNCVFSKMATKVGHFRIGTSFPDQNHCALRSANSPSSPSERLSRRLVYI